LLADDRIGTFFMLLSGPLSFLYGFATFAVS
jgi:hypothetical protein